MTVGRTIRVLSDHNRAEVLYNTGEKRRIIISIFYPIDKNWDESKQAFYIDLFHPRQDEFIKRFANITNSDGYQVSESYLSSIYNEYIQ